VLLLWTALSAVPSVSPLPGISSVPPIPSPDGSCVLLPSQGDSASSAAAESQPAAISRDDTSAHYDGYDDWLSVGLPFQQSEKVPGGKYRSFLAGSPSRMLDTRTASRKLLFIRGILWHPRLL
jgi:hypothetical protein